ncbi:MAG: MMPL family transporter [Deltaproteobacteria bacterium]|nr:MMPL family transporter [Deltaproteobacteria bacterium]
MHRLADRLSRTVLGRPVTTVVLFLLLGAISAGVASNLRFDTAFDALLAPGTQELLEVRALAKKAGGTVRLMIAVGGKKSGRLPFARRVVSALRKTDFIRYADVDYPIDFFLDRRAYFLPMKTLKKLRGELDLEVARARARANPLYVDFEDDAPKGAASGKDAKTGWRRFEALDKERIASAPELKRRFASPDGKYLYIQAKPLGSSYDMAAGKILFDKIKAVVRAQDPKRYGVFVRYAGALPVNQEQNSKMNADLRRASLIALALILGLMTLYTRKLVASIIFALPLLTGVGVTLALVQILFGQLNLVSGFLVSALLGLGIDYEIHLYLRYLEELSKGPTPRQAMETALQRTLGSNMTAAMTTAAAFFAIAIAQFRGFREYGLIAGMGVLITLVVTCAMLPPLAVLLSRTGKRGLRLFPETHFRRRFAWPMIIVGTLALIYSVVIAAPKVRWNSNFRKLRGISKVVDFTFYSERVMGGSLSPAAIYVKDIAEARKVQDFLDPLTTSKTSGVLRTLSLATMLPPQMKEKEAVVAAMRKTLQAVVKEDLKPKDRKAAEKALKFLRAGPWRLQDIPAVFRRPFSTVDGVGQFVIVWPRSEMVDEPEIVAWGEELNRIRIDLRERGIPARILDENRIGARVLSEMRSEAPLILAAAMLAVILILVTDTRSPKQVLLITGALGVGVAWMLGVMYIVDLEINVFNLAVLATVIGIGLDNAVHIQHRYREEGRGSLPTVVATTGGASFLASATTAIGFGAAVTAHHNGVQTLGWLALIGFTTTFISSTIFFPAVLRVLEGSQRQGVERDPL